MEQAIIKNSKGEVIELTDREARLAELNQRHCNALGYEIPITTMTQISKKISEQQFFEIRPSEYMPVIVGQGAFSTNILTYRSYQLSDDFSTGIINTGANNSRMAQADAGVDSVTVQVNNWAKANGWSLFDLELAARAGNWDVVTAKERARKRNWDLGIQAVAFLGLAGAASGVVQGLLNLSGVTNDTTFMSGPISGMAPTDLKAFCAGVLNVYRQNANRTSWPTHFVIPESDYLGLASPASAQFPNKSVMELLEQTFQIMTRNKKFQILPCAYGDAIYNTLGTQRYALYRSDEEDLNMNIPVDYTNTLANSLDNFNFQNVGYGQFAGVQALRPLTIYYFSFVL